MNDFFVSGYLTRDPELRQTPQNNVEYTTFSVAFHDRHKMDSKTSFLPVVAWRRLARQCSDYLKKGMKVTVVGSVSTRDYDDAQGVRRYVTEIVAREVVFYPPRSRGEARVLERDEPHQESLDERQCDAEELDRV